MNIAIGLMSLGFVIVMGICALALVHKDLWLYAESLLALFHVSTDRHSAQVFLDFADNITDARLKELGAGYTNCAPTPEARLLRSMQEQCAAQRKLLG